MHWNRFALGWIAIAAFSTGCGSKPAPKGFKRAPDAAGPVLPVPDPAVKSAPEPGAATTTPAATTSAAAVSPTVASSPVLSAERPEMIPASAVIIAPHDREWTAEQQLEQTVLRMQ